jgi:pSer/pThr/pTyr-binding forkhead associated (FHA) protein
MNMSLCIIEAGRSARRITLADTLTIGRDSDNGIVLATHTVSRCHAMLFRDSSGWQLIDLESTNGTLVNSILLPLDEPVHLADGDVLQFGQVLARIELPTTTELATEYSFTSIYRHRLHSRLLRDSWGGKPPNPSTA